MLLEISGSNPYDVEVTNRLKGLYLIDRVPEEIWMEVRDILQEAVTKTIRKVKKKKHKTGKIVVRGRPTNN